jgi:Sulfotransferase family
MASTGRLKPVGAAARAGSARPSASRAPDFFIVGHSKCGTTALHGMLRSHPQIYMPLKEPRFFALELRSRFRRLGPETLPVTLEDYLALFAGAKPEQRVGEASPQYLRSRSAASRIGAVRPDARIIAIFREPASFLRSFHLQAVHNCVETQTNFAKAIRLENARRAGRRIPLFSQSPQGLLYSEHVRYAEQLRRFHAVFPRQQVLVLIYDDFLRDNEETVRTVLRFLEVDDSLPLKSVVTRPLPAVRSSLLHRLTLGVSVVRRRVPTTRVHAEPGETRSRSHGRTLGASWRRVVYTSPRPPDEELMLELRRRFKPEVVALSEYLGRDLVALWGYESIR